MEIIQICPVCGQPAVSVNEKAVHFFVKDSKNKIVETGLKWSICIHQHCECSYFSKHNAFKTTDLVQTLFFKDKSDEVPICYCSDLTKGEIKNAVKNGCKTQTSLNLGKVQIIKRKKRINFFCYFQLEILTWVA